MSLVEGEAGVSGISGKLKSSSPSSLGGAPRAADGGRIALGLGVSKGSILREAILGGRSGLGAAAGVVGVDVRNVLTITSDSADPEGPPILKLDTVVVTVWLGVCPPPSRVEKFRRQATASISISSSSLSRRCLTCLKKGETEWGRMIPRSLESEEELPPYPSSAGGAEGCTASGAAGS